MQRKKTIICLGSDLKCQLFSLLYEKPLIFVIDDFVAPFDFEFIENPLIGKLFNLDSFFRHEYRKIDLWRMITFSNTIYNNLVVVNNVSKFGDQGKFVEVVYDYYNDIVQYDEMYIFNDHERLIGYEIYDLFVSNIKAKKMEKEESIHIVSDKVFYNKIYVDKEDCRSFENSETMVRLFVEGLFDTKLLQLIHKKRYKKPIFSDERSFNFSYDDILEEIEKKGIKNVGFLKAAGMLNASKI